ncbi:MAG: hypothetical protein IJX59_08340, partial [Clostridia bacterium]|nr:hypothetical protein [Clostridia bacterium]
MFISLLLSGARRIQALLFQDGFIVGHFFKKVKNFYKICIFSPAPSPESSSFFRSDKGKAASEYFSKKNQKNIDNRAVVRYNGGAPICKEALLMEYQNYSSRVLGKLENLNKIYAGLMY